jgi:hypothetical protein
MMFLATIPKYDKEEENPEELDIQDFYKMMTHGNKKG